MSNPWAVLSQHELMTELDSVEQAISRSRTFLLYTNEAGRTRLRVSPELLTLAAREHDIVRELRRRGRTATLAA